MCLPDLTHLSQVRVMVACGKHSGFTMFLHSIYLCFNLFVCLFVYFFYLYFYFFNLSCMLSV